MGAERIFALGGRAGGVGEAVEADSNVASTCWTVCAHWPCYG